MQLLPNYLMTIVYSTMMMHYVFQRLVYNLQYFAYNLQHQQNYHEYYLQFIIEGLNTTIATTDCLMNERCPIYLGNTEDYLTRPSFHPMFANVISISLSNETVVNFQKEIERISFKERQDRQVK